MNKEAIQKAIEEAKERIDDVDMSIAGDIAGLAQAMDELRQGLDKIDECIDQRKYEKPSRIGYNEIAHSFVFLQRALAGLQSTVHDKQSLISDIVMKSGASSYEDVEPFVHEAMGTMRVLTEEERAKNKEISKKYIQEVIKPRLKAVQNGTAELLDAKNVIADMDEILEK